jgi:hypothetical protein
MTLILSGTDGLSDIDGSASTPAIRGTDANTGIFFPTADTIAFAEGGAESARFDSSGNFLQGTTSWGYSGNKGIQVRASGSDNSSLFLETASATIKGFMASDPTASRVGLGSLSNHPLVFIANDAERARINSSGNFLVGTTSTFDVTAGATTQLSGALAVFTAGSPNTLVSFYNSSQAARVGFIGSSGNSTQYNSGSDYRLKDNVINMSGALSKISTLRPVTFTWKVSPEVGLVSGFIAHELDEVFPEAVTGEKDAMCDDGVTPNYQMVDQSKLVPLLVAAIQEQQQMIETLQAKVAALEAKG